MITQNQPPAPKDGGGNGGLAIGLPAAGDRHFRRNCRDIVQILQLYQADGTAVFSKQEIVALLRGAVPLAAAAAKEGRARDYRAAMGVIFEAAKAEQADKPDESVNLHLHAEADVDELIKLMETEVEARGLAVDEPGNGDADSAPPPD